MIGLEAPEAYSHYTPSQYYPPPQETPSINRVILIDDSLSIDPTYPVHGGLFEKEAIMLLRRFYIQENEKGMQVAIFNLSRLLISRFHDSPQPETEEEQRAEHPVRRRQ